MNEKLRREAKHMKSGDEKKRERERGRGKAMESKNENKPEGNPFRSQIMANICFAFRSPESISACTVGPRRLLCLR